MIYDLYNYLIVIIFTDIKLNRTLVYKKVLLY